MSQIGQYLNPLTPGLLETLTGAQGGGPVEPVAGNITLIGLGNISIVGNPGFGTLTIAGGGFFWVDELAGAVNLAVNTGYVMDNAGGVTGTLPLVANIGDIISIVGKGAGGWLIAQNAGQTIHFGNMDTTTGALGSLGAISQYDCCDLVCITANTDFVVKSSIGNLAVT